MGIPCGSSSYKVNELGIVAATGMDWHPRGPPPWHESRTENKQDQEEKPSRSWDRNDVPSGNEDSEVSGAAGTLTINARLADVPDRSGSEVRLERSGTWSVRNLTEPLERFTPCAGLWCDAPESQIFLPL